MLRILFVFLITSFCAAQSKNFTGTISSEAQSPLEAANIIAKPSVSTAQLRFAVSDNKGRFKLELDKDIDYEITASYIGYISEAYILKASSGISEYRFVLQPTSENLQEITVKYDYQPIVIKKDTITYDVKSFTNGNERKLKEILNKLPGVEVDRSGGVTVQGKKVTRMLVEGKSFFGGGTKLAVDNIPADAVDKIEILDHFNDIGFMKKVSESQDLAMNVKLKEDKKKFVFGDIEAGGGNDKYYLLHAALFYYSQNSNVSFIGDVNNIGRSTFTYEDLLRFDGGFSSYLTGRKPISNLLGFLNDNTDAVQNRSQFAALNLSHDFSKKFSVSGYLLFSKVLLQSKTESLNDYLQNGTRIRENATHAGSNKNVLGLGNIKLDYSPDKLQKWYYNIQYKLSDNDAANTIRSITDNSSNVFETFRRSDNASFRQYLEWHKELSESQTATFVINHAYDGAAPTTQWYTDKPFLQGLIPLQQDATYKIDQEKISANNTLDILFKHYWIINNSNHLYTSIGNNYGYSHFTSAEKQRLSDGTINDFAAGGFGNDITYKLNDAYIGLDYKFSIGKLVGKPGVYVHWYQLKTVQADGKQSIDKVLLQPQFTAEYTFSKSESLNFQYSLINDFASASQLADRYTLQSYNLVFKGNALLSNERYHSAFLTYKKFNLFKGIEWNATANFYRKIQTIRNEVVLDAQNQFTTPVLTHNPETNWRVRGAVNKKIYWFTFGLNGDLSWFDYTQTLNAVMQLYQRRNQEIGITAKTSYKKWPVVTIGYTKTFSQFSGTDQSDFEGDVFDGSLELNMTKDLIFKADYQAVKNSDHESYSNHFDIANVSLRYQTKNSPFGFEFSVSNLFNVENKNDYFFSDYLISRRTTYILPRIFMLAVSYKL